MNCDQIRERLVDLLYEELDHEERGAVTGHLESCTACQSRWARVRAVASAADRWSAPPVSRGIAERALVRVTAEQRAPRAPRLSPAVIAARLLLGGGASLVSLLLVAGVANGQTTAVGAAALAVIWTVLYSGLLLASHHPSIRSLAPAALVGTAGALVLVPVLSIPSVVEACERWATAAQSSAPFTLVLLVVAAGYTAGPLVVGGLIGSGAHDRRGVVDGVKLSLLYGLMIAPAVYLQCLSLPLEITALWMSGAVLGAALAGPASLHLARLRTKPA